MPVPENIPPHRQYAHLYGIVALALLMLGVAGCGLFHNVQRSELPKKPWCVMHLVQDTVYATPADSASFFLDAGIQDDAHAIWHIDFGDGKEGTLEYDGYHNVETHLYKLKRTYTASLWIEADSIEICRDSIVVIVQDYVRPSLAKILRISIKGITLYSCEPIIRPGMTDSVALSEKDDCLMEFESRNRNTELVPFPWHNTQGMYTGIFEYISTPGPDEYVYGTILLSEKGDSLKTLDLSYKSIHTTNVNLRGIPLDNNAQHDTKRAIYTVHVKPDRLSDHLVSLYRYNQSKHTVYYNPYSDVTITVEFLP